MTPPTEWIHGKVSIISKQTRSRSKPKPDGQRGQITITYRDAPGYYKNGEITTINWRKKSYIVHCDNVEEIASFTSRAGIVDFSDREQDKLKAFKLMRNMLRHEDLRWELQYICGVGRDGAIKCLAQKVFGKTG